MRLSLNFNPHVLSRLDLTRSSRRNLSSKPVSIAAYQRLTMPVPRSPKINATGQNHAQLTAIDDVVNRNADSVYQTDAVLILAGDVQRRRSGAPKIKQ
jgi:hypothetical protein